MDSSSIPGVSVGQKPRRFVPRFHWELLACGTSGHEIAGLDAAQIRPEDSALVREHDGVRWYRCLRCDSWIPITQALPSNTEHPPPLDEIDLPLRGKPLRDKIVLRLIAVDRAFHFLVLGLLALAVLLLANHQADLHHRFYRVLNDLQNALGGTQGHGKKTGLVHEIDNLLTLQSSKLKLAGAGIAAYALLEGVEAVGLWWQKRWAEYLTFLATVLLLPLEVYELSHKLSPFKIIALIINVAIVIYLLFAKRLFGLRGGTAAEEALRERDVGVDALLRATP